jgi:hypothetical protein
VKKYCTAGQATDDSMAHTHYNWGNITENPQLGHLTVARLISAKHYSFGQLGHRLAIVSTGLLASLALGFHIRQQSTLGQSRSLLSCRSKGFPTSNFCLWNCRHCILSAFSQVVFCMRIILYALSCNMPTVNNCMGWELWLSRPQCFAYPPHHLYFPFIHFQV